VQQGRKRDWQECEPAHKRRHDDDAPPADPVGDPRRQGCPKKPPYGARRQRDAKPERADVEHAQSEYRVEREGECAEEVRGRRGTGDAADERLAGDKSNPLGDLLVQRLPLRRVRPDVAFTRRKVAVFVDGCFWHACPEHGSKPKSNEWYWSPKLARNVERDRAADEALAHAGWAVVRLWEHIPLADAVALVVDAVGEPKSLR